jgi:hypothetical protein
VANLGQIANVASILGLVTSLVAFWQAKRAATAAAEARDAIGIRTLVDEIESTCVRLEQLLDFLRHNRLPESALRVTELAGALSEIPSRRAGFLDESQINDVLTTREQLSSIADVIHKNSHGALVDPERGRVLRTAGRALMSMRGLLGAMKSQIEFGANHA